MLFRSGTKGKRYSLPNCRILIHQPMGGFQGQATDVEIHAREILKMRERLNEILSKHTGQPMERVRQDTERDLFLSAVEAKAYGIVDEVIERALPRDKSKPSTKDGGTPAPATAP